MTSSTNTNRKLPRIKSIKVADASVLKIVFAPRKGDKPAAVHKIIDLSGMIAREKFLEPLRADSVFRQAKIIDWGAAVGWPDDREIGAATLLRLANEQEPFDNADFVAWQKRAALSNQEAADALGVTIGTIKNLRAGKVPVRTAVAIACRALGADPIALAAHFKPRQTGRPKAA